MASHVISVDQLARDSAQHLGRRLRLVRPQEYQSPDNPNGVPLPRPTLLRRQDNLCPLPTYGEQVLQQDAVYVFGGADARTLVFIDEKNDMPMQIFRDELPGANFMLL